MAVLIVAIGLLATACGGDSDSDSDTAVNDEPAAESEQAESDPVDAPAEAEEADVEPDEGTAGDLSLVPAGETDLLGNPAGQGFVELDNVRYDFVLNAACQKIFGAVQASGSPADGSDGHVDSIVPPEDWETKPEFEFDPPSVEIDIGDDSWVAELGSVHFVDGANVELTPEQSSVTSFTNDGARVSGEANFYSAFNFETIETTSGVFEFYCP